MTTAETVHFRLGACYKRRCPMLWVLERELLVFPLAVVLLATAAFWFGGKCAPWQTMGGGGYCPLCGVA